MCIDNHRERLERECNKKGLVTLWKVVTVDNTIGVWRSTYSDEKFVVGVNTAQPFDSYGSYNGRFHCFFTRDVARTYKKYHLHTLRKFKIIKVYADRKDIVDVGLDSDSHIFAISVSKMEIKSLKHQR